jgi:protein-arginine kinase activator protein McsA
MTTIENVCDQCGEPAEYDDDAERLLCVECHAARNGDLIDAARDEYAEAIGAGGRGWPR